MMELQNPRSKRGSRLFRRLISRRKANFLVLGIAALLLSGSAEGGSAVAPAPSRSFGAEYFELTLPSKRIVQAQVRFSVTPLSTQCPLVVVFGGFQNAARVLDLFETSDHVALASFDYPFEPPRKFKFPQSLGFAPEAKQMIHDSIAGIKLLHEKLRSDSRIDPNRTVILGASLGAPFAVYAAANDPRWAGLVVIHGFGKMRLTLQNELAKALKPHLGSATTPAALLLSWPAWFYLGLPEIEDAIQKLRPGLPVLIVQPTDDTSVPKAAQQSLIDAFAKSSVHIEGQSMPGSHLQPGQNERIRDILGRVRKWMKDKKLLMW